MVCKIIPFIFDFPAVYYSMVFYFSLQWVLFSRRLRELGFHPAIGIAVIGLLLVAVPFLLFSKTAYAEYIIAMIAIYLVTQISSPERRDFLKLTFARRYRIIRTMENILVIAPFMAILLFKGAFLTALILLVSGLGLAFIQLDVTTLRTIPTPFRKKPFEFIVGFRNTLIVFICCYLLTGIAALYRNPGLGAFSLLLSFLTCISFYLKTETEYYVWIFARTAREFLIQKIITALLQSTMICLPLTLLNCLFTPAESVLFIVIHLLGYVFLSLAILCKYASFPGDMSLPNILLFAMSLFFPPFAVVAAVYFYVKAVNNLKPILNADH